jgi:NitT/TauT family transport system permease protein
LPIIFNGLEIAAVFAVIGAVVGEFVGAQAGLGYLITTLNFNLDVPGVFAVLILLSLFGIMLHDVVRRIGRRLVFWIRSERIELMT